MLFHFDDQELIVFNGLNVAFVSKLHNCYNIEESFIQYCDKEIEH